MEKKKKTILLVDDEPENLRSYQEILNDLGYCVIARADAMSALSVIHERVPMDLMITDYRMEGMNGLELVNSLREVMPSLPVIMITAFGDIETYLESFSLGVFEYINKPVTKEEFERIVRAALVGSFPRKSDNGGKTVMGML